MSYIILRGSRRLKWVGRLHVQVRQSKNDKNIVRVQLPLQSLFYFRKTLLFQLLVSFAEVV
jgi:hypothetical protein